ncbi:MAG: SpaA isopeptide-forming pilin-related protein [Bacillota bacterium]|nr:SpaA isopeptide-forming pilin-related protein [Bacillota bacterium]
MKMKASPRKTRRNLLKPLLILISTILTISISAGYLPALADEETMESPPISQETAVFEEDLTAPATAPDSVTTSTGDITETAESDGMEDPPAEAPPENTESFPDNPPKCPESGAAGQEESGETEDDKPLEDPESVTDSGEEAMDSEAPAADDSPESASLETTTDISGEWPTAPDDQAMQGSRLMGSLVNIDFAIKDPEGYISGGGEVILTGASVPGRQQTWYNRASSNPKTIAVNPQYSPDNKYMFNFYQMLPSPGNHVPGGRLRFKFNEQGKAVNEYNIPLPVNPETGNQIATLYVSYGLQVTFSVQKQDQPGTEVQNVRLDLEHWSNTLGCKTTSIYDTKSTPLLTSVRAWEAAYGALTECTVSLTGNHNTAGYDVPDPVTFRARQTGAGYVIEVKDGSDWEELPDNQITLWLEGKEQDVTIKKQDDQNPPQPLVGAELAILMPDPDNVGSWIEHPGYSLLDPNDSEWVVQLRPGTYRLHELKAPEGYLAADDIEFQVSSAGEVLIGDSPQSAVVMTNAKAPSTILKFSVVEKGKADTQQLIGSTVSLIHNVYQYMENWDVDSSPVERELSAGTYTAGVISVPSGFALCSDITFRVNDDLSVEVTDSASDPDPTRWIWMALDGDTIRLEIQRGIPFIFRNIDLEYPYDELENARLHLRLSNDLTFVWDSGESPARYYLAPGTEGEYSVHVAPEYYVASEPIHFIVDPQGDLYVKDMDGNWFLQAGNTLVMDCMNESNVGTRKYNVRLGVRESDNADVDSLAGAVVKLQRFDHVRQDYYDIPGMQWRTKTQSRVVSLHLGEYRLVVLAGPEGYEYDYGTGIFRVDEDGYTTYSFWILNQLLIGGPGFWWQTDSYATHLMYRDVRPRIAVFRTGNKDSYTAGETVALAARAEEGSAPYRYQFYVVRSNGSKVILRNYASSNIFSWIPLTPDSYKVGVSVKDSADNEVHEERDVTVRPPAEDPLRIAVFRTGNKTSYNTGETVALAARAEGGTAPYRYQFYVIRSNGTRVILRDYAFSNTFNWMPVTPDSYQLGVSVKDKNDRQVGQVKNVTVSAALYVAVFRAGSKSTYTPGERLALAARAEHGATPYRYQFYVYRSNGAKVILRNFGFSNVYNWTPVTPDTYRVCVAVQDQTGKVVTKALSITVKPK